MGAAESDEEQQLSQPPMIGADDAIESDQMTKEVSVYSRDSMHLVDAIRLVAMERESLVQVGENLKSRWDQLKEAMNVEIPLIGNANDTIQPVGLMNPVNSKICYLNSVIQILLPIAPLMQLMSMSLSHVCETSLNNDLRWTCAMARAYRLIFNPPIGSHVSLLNAPGMDTCISDLGGIGTQQDVAEALCIVLDRLHEEWKYGGLGGGPLGENSIIYKIFRGIKRYSKTGEEMFTTIHLAPPGMSLGSGPISPTKVTASSSVGLVDLLSESFSNLSGQLIQDLPPVLCVELSRHLSENQLTTSHTSVPFAGSLRVPRSCCTDECNDRKYELIGVVVRSGVYANSGHFWVAQRRDAKWYWINDTDVSDCSNIDESDMIDSERNSISKKLDASSNWCVLVYADAECKIKFHP